MLQKIQETIRKNDLCAPTDKILVAVSGGADSMILAYCLHKLGYTIGVVHCNFQLRGAESAAEEDFVRSFSEKNGFPFFCKKFDTQAIVDETHSSIQVVARNLRYAFFEEILTEENYEYCALAHHADDQAETMFMSLLKGNSPQIWKAIPLKRGKYIRPMLAIRKAEIVEMAAQIGLTFCTDSSNLKNEYSRNYTRNVIFPALSQLNPNFVGHLLAKNDLYMQQMGFIQTILDKYLLAENEIDFEPFVTDFGQVFLELFILYFCQKKGVSGHLAQEVCALVSAISGKYVSLPNGKMIRTRTGLVFVTEQDMPISPQIYELETGEKVLSWANETLKFIFPAPKIAFSTKGDKAVFYIDTTKITFPLHIRKWQNGDKMMPLGMLNYKKISDIMIDMKYSPIQKQATFVITDATQEIIALSGFRISEKVKIGTNRENILEIRVLS